MSMSDCAKCWETPCACGHDYMRERNGHIDDGSRLKHSQTTCPNCGSSNFIETLSREKCNACGLECDYWGNGANEVYENMMRNNERREDERRQRMRDEEDEAEWRHSQEQEEYY